MTALPAVLPLGHDYGMPKLHTISSCFFVRLAAEHHENLPSRIPADPPRLFAAGRWRGGLCE